MNPDLEGFRLLGKQLEDPTPGERELTAQGGKRWHVHGYPRPCVRVILQSLENDATRMVVFEPSESRPAEYPAELPFMPGAGSTVATAPSNPPSLMVTWGEMNDPPAFAQRVQDECIKEGWEVTRPLASFPGFPVGVGELRRAGARRVLSMTTIKDRGMVALMQGVQGAAPNQEVT